MSYQHESPSQGTALTGRTCETNQDSVLHMLVYRETDFTYRMRTSDVNQRDENARKRANFSVLFG